MLNIAALVALHFTVSYKLQPVADFGIPRRAFGIPRRDFGIPRCSGATMLLGSHIVTRKPRYPGATMLPGSHVTRKPRYPEATL